MTDEKILQLLNSSNISDILIGLELIDDYLGFFRRHGINFYMSCYEIPIEMEYVDREYRFYYKLNSDYYIYLNNGYLSECREPYDCNIKIIESGKDNKIAEIKL